MPRFSLGQMMLISFKKEVSLKVEVSLVVNALGQSLFALNLVS